MLCLFILFYYFGETTGYGIKSDNTTIALMEDKNITLSCTYEGSVDSLHWYQQKPGSRSEFLIMIDEASEYVRKANPPYPHLSIKLHKAQKRVHLKISSAAVTDSAVYYLTVSARYVQRGPSAWKRHFFYESMRTTSTST